jgi:carbamate kinase
LKGKRDRVIISIGGNAIIRRDGTGAVEEQFRNTELACKCIAGIAASGGAVILTHGNGPVVGNIVIRNEAARDQVPPMPLYICDADSEGGIGFMIQQSLYNRLVKAHDIRDVVAVVTQVVVDPKDEAFLRPTKPIGPYYTEAEARGLEASRGWTMAGVEGDELRRFRRVVPSPRPVRIVESSVIKRLSDQGVIVIAAGGGGVPVIEREDGTLEGVDAVVDKDLSTSLLAREADSELFINLTEVDMVYEGFGTPGARGLKELNVEEARGYLARGEFPPGSMGPKIEAAVEFLEHGGKEVVITTPEKLDAALAGRAGTRLYR